MKVSVMIEPEEKNEGEYGATVAVIKENVVSLNQLVEVYLMAAKGAGWYVDDIVAYAGAQEFNGDY